ncbi:MAG TPA: flagellar hook-basal body protein [Symbiobacteriaceae bacterium]
MIRGVEASRRGMAMEQVRADVIADNVANLNTAGFKRSTAVGTEFGAALMHRLENTPLGPQGSPEVGPLGQGVELTEVAEDPSQGDLVATGNPLDVALLVPGQFVYLGPTGPGYTRNGAFHRDSAGRLVTAQGYPVLVNGRPVGAGAGTLRVEQDGTVWADGEPVGRLDLVGGTEMRLAVGYLERANVDLAQEMSNLIITLRSYQANQRALQWQDQTLSLAVSDLGKV